MLLMDIGNTRCKWCLEIGGERIKRGSFDTVDSSAWHNLLHLFPEGDEPDRLVISNVAGESVVEAIRELTGFWRCKVQFVGAVSFQCGVKNGYQQAGQLGSDRWAALVAARKRRQDACLVVSCGTATTVDALSPEGEFLGGLILPGIDLMGNALLERTAQLGSMDGRVCDFPTSTPDAIMSGIIRATVGAIMYQQELMTARFGTVICLLGGGAARGISPYLPCQHEYMEDMVLQGLSEIGRNT